MIARLPRVRPTHVRCIRRASHAMLRRGRCPCAPKADTFLSLLLCYYVPMRKTERLVAIALLLQARGKMTAERLAGIMDVSTRTIYRDMDTLSLAHVPVAMDY